MSKYKPFSAKIRRYVFEKTQGHCAYCGNRISLDFHIDHIIPASRGGSDDIENLVPSCQLCNLTKNDRTDEEFRYFLFSQTASQARDSIIARMKKFSSIFTDEQVFLVNAKMEEVLELLFNMEAEHRFYFEQIEQEQELRNMNNGK